MLAGTILGDHYEIECEVGRGARGVIFKARKNTSGRIVAVKVLAEDMLNDESAFERFESEAKTASTLKHDNIINVFDFGVSDEGFAYLVMEFLEGESLQQTLDHDGRLPLERSLKIFIQIADALAHAHSKNMLHRDVKPENIILAKAANNGLEDHIKVVDFGLARRFHALPGADMLKEDECQGSPAYMSPEQCMFERHLDARSDIYSLGCLMYATLTGTLPVTGNTPEEVMKRQISVDPPPISRTCPFIPGHVQEVVMKSLKKFREDRYQTMSQLKRDLELLLKQHSKR